VKGSNNGVGPVSAKDAELVAANAVQASPVAQPSGTTLSAAAVKTLGTSTRLYSRDQVPEDVNGLLTGLAELVTNDDGTLAWPDLQYVAFTVITLISFCAQLIANPLSGLPPVPAALLTSWGSLPLAMSRTRLSQCKEPFRDRRDSRGAAGLTIRGTQPVPPPRTAQYPG